MIDQKRVDTILASYPLETELDHLIACILYMREEKGKKGLIFKKDMEEYFQLSLDMKSSFIYDELIRLASTKAGTMKTRDTKDLQRIHDMHRGSYFRLNTRLCVFQEHKRIGKPTEGWFTFHYHSELLERTMDYDEAWSAVTNGLLTFGADK